ncbi:hypothetical protein SAY87_009852 [Trapa incisa]|uniref:Uncharacterized protein n=1 Tax=Trapa incisa TaxID=236973 RepID=A0AAN7Q3G7_9MYRT|nr:hypothetical protein SAY87_009852 [Trapa incisa]
MSLAICKIIPLSAGKGCLKRPRDREKVDSNVTAVLVTTLILQGWERKLHPRYDVMKTLQLLSMRADWA